MSFRDQRVGTSHLDRVKEDVSLEYITSVATNLYTFRYERSDELGGMAVNRFKDEYGSEWLETVAMTPQGIQPHSEEKEIVCWE